MIKKLFKRKNFPLDLVDDAEVLHEIKNSRQHFSDVSVKSGQTSSSSTPPPTMPTRLAEFDYDEFNLMSAELDSFLTSITSNSHSAQECLRKIVQVWPMSMSRVY